MVTVKAIFQPFARQTHKKEVVPLLAKVGAKQILVASAFVNSAGVEALKPALVQNVDVTRIFVGIRNGASTFQGLLALLSTGASIYVVDTGSPYRIFHPKLFIVIQEKTAQVVIGSANSTHAGLHNNIEAGVVLELDLLDKVDKAFLSNLMDPLSELCTKHPKHCYELASAKHARQLLNDGLIEDERSPRISIATGRIKASRAAALSIISLPFTPPPRSSGKKVLKIPALPSLIATSLTPAALSVSYGDLVWEKPSLPAGDLQFPGTGNPTGVLRLTQARFKIGRAVINQTTYFRRKVFKDLTWTTDPNDPDKEMATTIFSLVIGGRSYGEHDLQLSHKPKWESGQGNYTTALHWGTAMPAIKHRALIGRALRLYAPASGGAPYILEIDI